MTTQERTDGTGPQDSAGASRRRPDAQRRGGRLPELPRASRAAAGHERASGFRRSTRTATRPSSRPTRSSRRRSAQIDLTTRRIPNTINDKIIVTAKQVHDPATAGVDRPGWNMPVSGPVDVAFSADGATVYLVGELSRTCS